MKSEFIRDICLTFPGVKEDIKWGHDLCFLINKKMFCVTGIEGEFGVSLKVNEDEFEDLISRKDIVPAPYLARYKWIYVKKAGSFSSSEWKHYLWQSYELINSKQKSKSKSVKKTAVKSKIRKRKISK
jgi:predicted DNA-binding protein (MmcQ/YjbR family)